MLFLKERRSHRSFSYLLERKCLPLGPGNRVSHEQLKDRGGKERLIRKDIASLKVILPQYFGIIFPERNFRGNLINPGGFESAPFEFYGFLGEGAEDPAGERSYRVYRAAPVSGIEGARPAEICFSSVRLLIGHHPEMHPVRESRFLDILLNMMIFKIRSGHKEGWRFTASPAIAAVCPLELQVPDFFREVLIELAKLGKEMFHANLP
jgi:hypothetical protein